MQNSILIFLGCGFGGLFRYWVSNSVYHALGRNFPYGTLVVNVSGSFLIGFILTVTLERFGDIGPQLRALLIIGFLGGYTTFSSFSIETVTLLETSKWFSAFLNVFLSCVLCIGTAWLGVVLGRSL